MDKEKREGKKCTPREYIIKKNIWKKFDRKKRVNKFIKVRARRKIQYTQYKQFLSANKSLKSSVKSQEISPTFFLFYLTATVNIFWR